LARDRLFERNSRLTPAARLIQNCERNKAMQRLQRFALWVLQPKVGLPLALLLCLATSPFVYRATRLSGLPNCGHPFDVEAFGTQDVPDAENAFVEYRKAAKLYKEMPSSEADYDSFEKAMDEGWSEANANVRKWVADNRVFLEMWRRCTEKPDAIYFQPKDLTFETVVSLLDDARPFARLARLEGSRLEETGDLDGAWIWYRAVLRSSRHFGKRGAVMQRLTGISMHFSVSEQIARWAHHDELTLMQSRMALNDTREIFAMTAPTSVALKGEYLCIENTLERCSLPDFIDNEWEATDEHPDVEFFLRNEPELGRRVSRQVVTNWLRHIDTPRHQRPSPVPGRFALCELDPTITYDPSILRPEQIEEFAEKSTGASTLLPPITQFESAIIREQANQAALITMLALRLHQLETGHLPDTLNELVAAGILESVPIDPWHPTGKPLRYIRKGETAVVYSLGENGINDGGNIELEGQPDIGFSIQPVKSNNKP
jgi:hypothetical protein